MTHRLQAAGDWFSAGTNVKDRGGSTPEENTVRHSFVAKVAQPNTDTAKAVRTQGGVSFSNRLTFL